MSGGYFSYDQYRIHDMADKIERRLERQGKPRDKEYLWHDDTYYKKYPEELVYETYPENVQSIFKEAINALKVAAVYAQRVDWFISGDDGEESLVSRLAEDLKKLKEENE
jgi:hypothetical protein